MTNAPTSTNRHAPVNRQRAPLFVAALLLVTVTGCGVQQPPQSAIDLDAVLEVTNQTLVDVDRGYDGEVSNPSDTAAMMAELADELETNYNNHIPALHDGLVSVAPREDAALVAVADTNGNLEPDADEVPLWMIEIDGENARLVATDREGAVQQSGFSGTGLLAGMLIGSMLSRQRAAGVNTGALAAKQPVSTTQARQARQAARARAGSGSFARGK